MFFKIKILLLSFFLLFSGFSQAQTTGFKTLNFNDSIIIVKGNGIRKLAIFEDPNCPYCKQFEAQLAKLNNVTLYVFLYPILGADSIDKSNSIWCSGNSSFVWQQWMINRVTFPVKTCGETPVYRNMTYGKTTGLNATPSLIFEDNTKVTGAMDSSDIEKIFGKIYGVTSYGTTANTPMNKTPQPSNSINSSIFK